MLSVTELMLALDMEAFKWQQNTVEEESIL